jgi:hypothetical protein
LISFMTVSFRFVSSVQYFLLATCTVIMCYVFIYLETLYWYDGISVSGVLILASPDSPLLV